jgi:hypothetical protein
MHRRRRPPTPAPRPAPSRAQAAGRFVAGRKQEYLSYCRDLRCPEPPDGLEVAEWRPEVGFWRDTAGAWHLVRQDILRLANDAVFTAPQLPTDELAAAGTPEAMAELEAAVLAPLRAAAAAAGAPGDPFASRESGRAFAKFLQDRLGVLNPHAIEAGWALAPWEADLLPRGAEELRRHIAPNAAAAGAADAAPPPADVAPAREETLEAPWDAPTGARSGSGKGGSGSGGGVPEDPRDRAAAAREAAVRTGMGLEPPLFVWQLLPEEAPAPPLRPLPPPPSPPADPEGAGTWVPAPRALRGRGARRDERGGGGAPLAELRRSAVAGALPWGVTVQRVEDGLLLPLTQVRGAEAGAPTLGARLHTAPKRAPIFPEPSPAAGHRCPPLLLRSRSPGSASHGPAQTPRRWRPQRPAARPRRRSTSPTA